MEIIGGDEVWRVVVPFVVMVVMEGSTIGLTILAKVAMTYGMSPFVFIVYTNAIGSLLLLPYAFFSILDRSGEQSIFTFPLFLRFFFLGLTGITIAQNLSFVGLSYSSPYMVCAMGLLIPTFSFLLSILLRRTKVGWRSSSFQTYIVGSIISIIGAVGVNLYRGPAIDKTSLSSSQGFSSSISHWVLGGILLACASFSISVWNIIQSDTVKKYPEVMRIVSFYSIIGTLQCVVVALFLETDPNAWKLKLNLDLLLILVTAVFGSMIRTKAQVWCIRTKGPFFVPMFKPLGIIYATVFALWFFGTTIHYGSVVEICVIGTGYYTMMWAQIRQEGERIKETDDEKVPLLHQEDEDDDEQV